MNWEIGDRKGDKKKKCYQKKDNKKINLGVDNLMNDIMGDWTFIKCRVANATKASIPCLWKRLGWWRNTPFLGVEIAIKKIYILLWFFTIQPNPSISNQVIFKIFQSYLGIISSFTLCSNLLYKYSHQELERFPRLFLCTKAGLV